MIVGWDVKWCSVFNVTTPRCAKDRFPGFHRRDSRQGNFEILYSIIFSESPMLHGWNSAD